MSISVVSSVKKVGIGLSISRPLAVVSEAAIVSESMSIVSGVTKTMSVQEVGISLGLGLGLRLGLSLPLAIDETMAISESIAISEMTVSNMTKSVSETGVPHIGISLSLGEGHSSQGGNNNGFNHLGLFLHLVLGGESD